MNMSMFNPVQMQLAMLAQMKYNSGFPMFNQMQFQNMGQMFPFNALFNMQNMGNIQANGCIPFNKLPFFHQENKNLQYVSQNGNTGGN